MKKLLELYERYKEIINYLIVGGLTTVVSLGVYYVLVLTVLDPEDALQLQAANIISWLFAVAFAYFANRRFVFNSRNEIKKEAPSFVLARVGTLLMDMAFMFLTVTVLGMNDKIAKILDQVMITVSNYVISKWFVFRGNRADQ